MHIDLQNGKKLNKILNGRTNINEYLRSITTVQEIFSLCKPLPIILVAMCRITTIFFLIPTILVSSCKTANPH